MCSCAAWINCFGGGALGVRFLCGPPKISHSPPIGHGPPVGDCFCTGCLAVKSKFWPNTSFQYNIFSLATLKKSLVASGYDMEKNNSCLKLVLRSLVTKRTLLQIKGLGASGSFKLNKKLADPKDKVTCKQQSVGAKKVKRAAGAARVKKAVKKPASVAAKKLKSPAKPLKAKAKPKASTKVKPVPEKT
uniref:H15 domain-containing protein n=1 Tax=Laticauda laticaudata TaxID=8630 RepID=A0A8C5RRX4_LATLA